MKAVVGLLVVVVLSASFGCKPSGGTDFVEATQKKYTYLAGARLRNASESELTTAISDGLDRAERELLNRGPNGVETYMRTIERDVASGHTFVAFPLGSDRATLPESLERLVSVIEVSDSAPESYLTDQVLFTIEASAGPEHADIVKRLFAKYRHVRFNDNPIADLVAWRTLASIGCATTELGAVPAKYRGTVLSAESAFYPSQAQRHLQELEVAGFTSATDAPFTDPNHETAAVLASLQGPDREHIILRWASSEIPSMRKAAFGAMVLRKDLKWLYCLLVMEPGSTMTTRPWQTMPKDRTKLEEQICKLWVTSFKSSIVARQIADAGVSRETANRVLRPYLQNPNKEICANAIVGLAAFGLTGFDDVAWSVIRGGAWDNHGSSAQNSLTWRVFNAYENVSDPASRAFLVRLATGQQEGVTTQARIEAYRLLLNKRMTTDEKGEAIKYLEQTYANAPTELRVGEYDPSSSAEYLLGAMRDQRATDALKRLAQRSEQRRKPIIPEDPSKHEGEWNTVPLWLGRHKLDNKVLLEWASAPKFSQKVVDDVLYGLKNRRLGFRQNCEIIAAKWRRPEVSQPIRDDLKLWFMDAKLGAMYAATLCGDNSLSSDIAAQANDPRWPVRRSCAMALGQLDPVGNKPVLEKLAKDPALDVVEAARAALFGKLPPLRSVSDRLWMPEQTLYY